MRLNQFLATLLLSAAWLGSSCREESPSLPSAAAAHADLAEEWLLVSERNAPKSRPITGVLHLPRGRGLSGGHLRASHSMQGLQTYGLSQVAIVGDELSAEATSQSGEGWTLTGAINGDSLVGRIRSHGPSGVVETPFHARRGPIPLLETELSDLRIPPAPDPSSVGLEREDLSSIVLAAQEAHSYSVIVLSDGQAAVARSFGNPLVPMPLASVTKPIAAMSLAFLVESGQITLDTKLTRWFREFQSDARQDVSLRHVLTHTSGLEPGHTTELNKAANRLALARQAQLLTQPGSTYAYNNRAFQLISGIVTAETGRSIENSCRESIFLPLGITDYSWVPDSTGATPAYAGLSLKSSDVAVIGQMLAGLGRFRGRQILPSEWVASMLEPATPATPGMGGGAMVLRRGPDGAPIGFGHSGDGGQYLYVYPAANIVGVRTISWREDPEENGFVFGAFGRLMDDLALAKMRAGVRE